MHDTAMEIGALAIEIYCNGEGARILDLGSMDVNGSLRQVARPGIEYVGVDIEAGRGVDLVIEPNQPLPLPDDDFDMVVATSVMEHDQAFWMTFLEMCRKAKPGGYVYFNAPSNGLVHRYPEDHWRFYPDCGKALVRWAHSQGIKVELVESFIAARRDDIWNDFTAVFRRLPATRNLPNRAICQEVACFNIITRDNPELVDPQYETEDMQLLSATRNNLTRSSAELARVEAQLFKVQGEAASLATLRENAEVELRKMEAILADSSRELADMKGHLSSVQHEAASLATSRDRFEVELMAARETLSNLEAEKAGLSENAARMKAELANAVDRQVKAEFKLAEADSWVFSLSEQRTALQADLRRAKQRATRFEREILRARSSLAEAKLEEQLTAKALAAAKTEAAERQSAWELLGKTCHELEAEARALRQELDRAREDLNLSQTRLQERNREVGTLSLRIVAAEKTATTMTEDRDWHRQVSALLTDPQKWWWAFLPKASRQARLDRRLSHNGLFDSQAYLRRYPDVRSSGLSAICHYIRHGRGEGRSWR